MNLDEFEMHYRESMREVLDELQYVVMLSAQLQEKMLHLGTSLQNLNQTTEVFIRQQRSSSAGDHATDR